MKALSERHYYKQIVSQNLYPKADAYTRFAFVEQAIGARLLEALDLMKINPTLILDLGSGTGHDAKQLAIRYPEARVIQLDLNQAMLATTRGSVPVIKSAPPSFPRKRESSENSASGLLRCARNDGSVYICADAEAIPLETNSVDLVFANALLPWLPDFEVVFKEVNRVLKTGGLFLFSCFGPDTLKECNQVLSRLDMRGIQDNATLVDMHDIGDQLLQESFEHPVMDSSMLHLEYKSPFALLRDLHRTGWSYAIPSMDRFELKIFLKDFAKYYEAYQNGQGHYLATLEVVMGHAWCGVKKEAKTTLELRVL